jgi:histidine ammonia-lyase
MASPFVLSTAPWTLDTLQSALAPGTQVSLHPDAIQSIQRCHDYLADRLAASDAPVYGINTGFGALRNSRVDAGKLTQLQINLVRSHACGAGPTVPPAIVRTMLLLKARSLSYGHSGVQVATVQRLLDFYNAGITPVIYTQGSLGASGDLAPLAHLSLALLGEGEVTVDGQRQPAADMLAAHGWQPLDLHPKEGLALLNGTQFMLAYAVHILLAAQARATQATRIAALSLDGYDGRIDPFQAQLHAIRPHAGQVAVAAAIRQHLQGSSLIGQVKTDVQDPYSFRCVPQVHGASIDTIAHFAHVILTEVNSTTDNPNIFPEEDLILSGGNFHGQPLALVLDFMAIALAELGAISERRLYLLLSGQRGLPAFLVANPGLNSGLMIAQYTAAAIASKNKQLCTPASIDTIPSSNGQEDHVSMGANAAVKCLEVAENLRTLLGIELMAASQALYFRTPLGTSPSLNAWLVEFRKVVPIILEDRVLQPDIAAASDFLLQKEFDLGA